MGRPLIGPDLTRRRLEAELMDDPGLEPVRHVRALEALTIVNLLSGTAGRVWRELLRAGLAPGRPVRVLDLACGGGDVAVALARRAGRSGLPLEVHGCDRSPVALEHARRSALRAGVEVRFFELDVLASPLPGGYDLLCSSLFLHHLTGPQAVALLAAMARAADALFVQDLRRTRLGWALAWGTLRTFARSEVARVDGLRSVAGAFSLDEADAMAVEAGLAGAVVTRCWPQRFGLSWRRR
ncbi:MAG TPA: methyltransferase domain-containing protein [Longimicrobiales bacterium]|nr:methyltransferase domain-containing protein [Longimicrobiales bacterium]